MFLTLAAETKLSDALTLMIVGMAVVFGALAILLGVVTLINRFTRDTTPAQTSAPAPSDASSGGDKQLVAVLAAAATAALGKPVRVTDVQPADPRD